MTTTADLIEEAMTRREAAQRAETVAAIIAARPRQDETTTTIEYALAERGAGGVTALVTIGTTDYVVGRVRVARTVFADPEEPDYLRVEGWTVEATRDGRPKQRATRAWRYLPDDLAEQLAATAPEKDA